MVQRFGSWLLQSHTGDLLYQRRARNLQIITLGMFTLSFVATIITLVIGTEAFATGITIFSMVVHTGLWWLTRRGNLQVATILQLGITIVLIGINLPNERYPLILNYYALVIVIASTIVSSRQLWWVFVVILAACLIGIGLPPQRSLQHPDALSGLMGSGLFLLMCSIFSFLNASSTARAVQQLDQAAMAVEQAQAKLDAAKRTLEATVTERTNALAFTLDQQREQATALQQSLQTQQQLSQTILDLSVPVIPVTQQVLVVPMIGTLNSDRVQQLLNTVLTRIEQSRARAIVLDVTGVPIIDSQIAGAIIGIASATQLLGARTVLVGIRPEVAQTLVTLGINFQQIESAASLQEGLRFVGVRLAARTARRRS
ncbi:MAG: STAS domain-containing protein [Roseiflexaceae bacterium]